MEHVTKTHFDKTIGGLKAEIGNVKREVGGVKREVGSVKREVGDLRIDIRKDIHDLAKMVAKGFVDVEKRLDVRERVEELEAKMKTVETALNVRL